MDRSSEFVARSGGDATDPSLAGVAGQGADPGTDPGASGFGNGPQGTNGTQMPGTGTGDGDPVPACVGAGCEMAETSIVDRDDVDTSVACEPTGMYAIQASIDLAWGGNSGGLFDLTDDGRGDMIVRMLARVDQIGAGNDFLGRLRVCHTSLPPFYSTTLCEAYQPIFHDAIWDSEKMPEARISGRFECLHPGCEVRFDATVGLLGVDLLEPEGAWPLASETADLLCGLGMGESCFPDHDNDGAAGITVHLLTAGNAPAGIGCAGIYPYSAAPLNASPAAIFDGVRRSDRMYIGTRTKLGGSGIITADCNSGVGGGIAEMVQSRAWGCGVQEGSFDWPGPSAGSDEDCSDAEASFMNENMPMYTILTEGEAPTGLDVPNPAISRGPRFALVRLGDLDDPVSCDDVRTATY